MDETMDKKRPLSDLMRSTMVLVSAISRIFPT